MMPKNYRTKPLHPRVLISRLKTRVPFFIWLAVAVFAVYLFYHGGQFGGMTGTVMTTFDNAAPLEAGRLLELFVDVGDTVKKGDPLAQMDASLLIAQKAVFEAEAAALDGELAAVTAETRRLEELMARRLASEQDILSLRIKERSLEAQIAASEIGKKIHLLDMRIQNCTLCANADGMVSRVYNSPGDIVQSGAPVLSSVIEQEPTVVGFLSEYNSRDVAVGMDVFLVPSSGVGGVIPATVVSLTPDVFALPGRVNPIPTQTYRGRRVIMKPEPGAALLPGEEVQIHFRSPWTLRSQPKDTK
ncbi:MAG: HlyD family efflux transporter periplasmic adaptor subunit [Kiritimatiellales bacterium]|nr:HlyD family efflux transporter periplasmic adaptor subunit [Kiritimatiellota bacterium]MBL7011376.1 HlyD family efflux transporter periplasmic adaptor subunit [Kiritimatiellales bacterium]